MKLKIVQTIDRSRHGMSAFVGLDVHSEMNYATVLDFDVRVVAHRKLVNEGVPEFLKVFNVERVDLEASTHVVPLYRALVGEGYRVQVSHRSEGWEGVAS